MSDPQLPLPISLRRRRAITAGLLLGMLLGALEATVVATVMPTVIASVGGLAHYSWVFSAYLLTSTAAVPIWGRLSDLYGRRLMYLGGVGLFLAGSVWAGAASSMTELIAARAVQGLGAGGILPLSMTIVGELYALSERARTQALFSGVWGMASILGPLAGGYITDSISWRWVFYLNVPFGLLCAAVIAIAYPAFQVRRRVRIDWLGAALLFSGVSTLLIAFANPDRTMSVWLAASAALLGMLVVVERRAEEPILPIALLKDPLMVRTLTVVFLVGVALFGAIAFIPLFAQAVQGGTATEAGQALTPLFLGWVAMSIAGARATLRFGYRAVSIAGSALMTVGFVLLAMLDADSGRSPLLVGCSVIGAGMGMQMLSLLLAVQHGVDRAYLGLATSLNQFSRSIGAAVGVAAMGALLAAGLTGTPLAGGAEALVASGDVLSGAMRYEFAAALHRVFVMGAIVSAAGLVATLFLPAVHFARDAAKQTGEEQSATHLATLEADRTG